MDPDRVGTYALRLYEFAGLIQGISRTTRGNRHPVKPPEFSRTNQPECLDRSFNYLCGSKPPGEAPTIPAKLTFLFAFFVFAARIHLRPFSYPVILRDFGQKSKFNLYLLLDLKASKCI